jgi:O-methyltransferase
MGNRLRNAIQRFRGRSHAPPEPAQEIPEEYRSIVEAALPYTMTGPARLTALIDAVTYCQSRGVEGSLIECGVWRGGSVLAMILALQAVDADPRDIYLYDTFDGMTEPTEHDRSPHERSAIETWDEAKRNDQMPWSPMFGPEAFSEAQVRETLLATGYPRDRLHFIRGPVEQTLPDAAPSSLALLRLDTDWYESTRHELIHLYPRLVPGGVLIIDDYGHWEGARRAVDEYFASVAPRPLFNRIDYTGRIAVKS